MSDIQRNTTEVARLVKEIQVERQIVLTALEELAEGQAKQRFLASCLQKMHQYQDALVPLVGKEQARVLAITSREEA